MSVDDVHLCVTMSMSRGNLFSVAVSLLILGWMRYTYVASSSKRVLDVSYVNARPVCLDLPKFQARSVLGTFLLPYVSPRLFLHISVQTRSQGLPFSGDPLNEVD